MEDKTKAAEVRALKAHLALNVASVERSVEFYRKMLGLEPSKVRTGYAKFDVENPPLNLTLNESPPVQRGAISHLGIQVASTEDVLAARERWRSAGLSTFDEMGTNCCYALQDKTWVTDPDGNEWEAFVVHVDNLPETSACCGTDATAVASEAGGTEAATAKTGACATDAKAGEVSSSCCAPAPSEPVAISR